MALTSYRHAAMAAFVWFLTLSTVDTAQASCQGYSHREHQCPVGDATYTLVTGCTERYFSQLLTDPFVIGEERTARRWQRCSSHDFPVYRAFTNDERGALERIVSSDEYQSRREHPWGQLSVWIEQQLTGGADPDWHGEMLLWDVMKDSFYGREGPDPEHRGVLAAAAPLFIEGTEASGETGPALARRWARIAYVQYHAGQKDAALGSQARAEEAIGVEPQGDYRDLAYGFSYSPELTAFREARHHLDVLDSCLNAHEGLRDLLCSAGGIGSYWWFSKWYASVAYVAATQEAIADDPAFKQRLIDGFFTPKPWYSHNRPIKPRAWHQCTLADLLDTDCAHERPAEERKPDWLRQFPDVFEAVEAERLRRYLPTLMSRFDWPTGGLDRKEASRRLAAVWPDLMAAYEADRLRQTSRSLGQCEVQNRYYGIRGSCAAESMDRMRSERVDEAAVERARQDQLVESSFSIMSTYAECTLRAKLGLPFERSLPCMRSFADPNNVEAKLREDLADFDERYAEAEADKIMQLAKGVGGGLANLEFSEAFVVGRNIGGGLPPDYAASTKAQATRLTDLYPDTAEVIEAARLAEIERRTMPR